MLHFFPEPYEDELLYSTIARYHYYYGNVDYKDTLYEIFGATSVVPSIEFPSRLEYLSNQIISNKFSSEYIIFKQTLYLFYAPFLTSAAQKNIINAMKFGHGKGIYARIGGAAGGICRKEGLFYCPCCIEKDEERYNEPYFHRMHQLQGVSVCHEHKCILKQYPITKKVSSRIEFIRLEKKKVDLSQVYEEDEQQEKILISLAYSAKYLLETELSDFNRAAVAEKYYKILGNKGFLTCNGSVKQEKLCDEFIDYYGVNLLKRLNSDIDFKNESNWLKILLRKPKRIVHPMRHILFILFLCSSIEEFFEKDIEDNTPFGTGPWPCLNQVAEHYRRKLIEKCIITPDYKTRHPVGTFKCICGFTYSRKGPDTNVEDIYRIGRIKTFGELWGNKLSDLLSTQKYGLRQLARIMCCDQKTIMKYASKLDKGFLEAREKSFLGLNVDFREKGYDSNIHELYKKQILELMDKEPWLNRSDVRAKLKKQYAWFYRHDKEWLNENLPSAIPVNKRRDGKIDKRVNWIERDQLLLMKAKDVYEKLLLEIKPARITESIFEKKLGMATLLRNCYDKLPETWLFIKNHIESVEEFQMRRVEKICGELLENKRNLKKWEIVKLAGLKPGYSKRVDSLIEKHVEKYKL